MIVSIKRNDSSVDMDGILLQESGTCLEVLRLEILWVPLPIHRYPCRLLHLDCESRYTAGISMLLPAM